MLKGIKSLTAKYDSKRRHEQHEGTFILIVIMGKCLGAR